MNILIAVANKHGSTREIAEAIASDLRGAGVTVDVKDAAAVGDLAPYDAVVLGSAIYGGTWLLAARGFVEQFHGELAQRPLWMFSSGPLGADEPLPHDDPQRLVAPLGEMTIRDHQIFVGKLDKSKLGLGERLIANVVGAPDGDFRDWEAIQAWAHKIMTALHTADVSQSVECR